jgi:hypothetical protein
MDRQHRRRRSYVERMVMRPLLRMRPDCAPVLTSVAERPISASLRFQVPRTRRDIGSGGVRRLGPGLEALALVVTAATVCTEAPDRVVWKAVDATSLHRSDIITAIGIQNHWSSEIE